MITVKQIEWSEINPTQGHPYDHVIGESNLGKWEITWKGWKDRPNFEIESPLDYYIGSDVTLEGAKEHAQEIFKELILSCIESELEVG